MHQNRGNLQRAMHKQAATWLLERTNAHETATNHHKRRFFVFHVPLRVPDSVWPARPRETLRALTVACVPLRVDAWLFRPNGMVVALPTLPATTDATVKPDFSATTHHNESNENPASIPFGRLQHRKSHTITGPML